MERRSGINRLLAQQEEKEKFLPTDILRHINYFVKMPVSEGRVTKFRVHSKSKTNDGIKAKFYI